VDTSPHITGISTLHAVRAAPDGPQAAFTVDVEDWYQSSVDYDAPITERVVRNVDRVFRLLDDHGVTGTFFVQGRVAEEFPRLVQQIVALGHEVQSHGYSHRPLFKMNRAQLRDEIERSRKTVEDAAQCEVTAFRAQDFSIGPSNLWALETLAEVGFTVDSSIFPMHAPRYGIAGWNLAPHRLHLRSGRMLLEVPVAIWALGPWRLPVAGGGYFRVLPCAFLVRALRGIYNAGRPPVIYCHPYEFADDELRSYRGTAPMFLRLAQGLGRTSVSPRMHALLTKLTFGRFDAVLATWGVT
jgi:polysaccharide deacetylase family protein (PEP-CTERM system associated)